MSPTNQRNDLEIERQLADFADQVMEGKMNHSASSVDDELLGLEETILRLDRAFPKKIIEDATSKQMLVRLKARMRREEQVEKPSFWKSLFNFQSSPQMGMALAVLAVLVLAVIAAPVLTSTTGTATGTASSSTSLPIVAGMVVLLLLALYWFGRKK
ncbi:MAG TPA: LPXTG cell wall anchor domain-containing protein [Anaerolineales bacterium]|nr:LPXTG cell wall anchor domain-containing protein [Anaerolineales bacterium]HNA88022.1 LPXTG cell wall anchor domain-containing protein [Anaerolineales bacterium]HNC07182.1 LPXTG cell wall anchor domain-containing protein [Anaerolineales bacterium]